MINKIYRTINLENYRSRFPGLLPYIGENGEKVITGNTIKDSNWGKIPFNIVYDEATFEPSYTAKIKAKNEEEIEKKVFSYQEMSDRYFLLNDMAKNGIVLEKTEENWKSTNYNYFDVLALGLVPENIDLEDITDLPFNTFKEKIKLEKIFFLGITSSNNYIFITDEKEEWERLGGGEFINFFEKLIGKLRISPEISGDLVPEYISYFDISFFMKKLELYEASTLSEVKDEFEKMGGTDFKNFLINNRNILNETKEFINSLEIVEDDFSFLSPPYINLCLNINNRSEENGIMTHCDSLDEEPGLVLWGERTGIKEEEIPTGRPESVLCRGESMLSSVIIDCGSDDSGTYQLEGVLKPNGTSKYFPMEKSKIPKKVAIKEIDFGEKVPDTKIPNGKYIKIGGKYYVWMDKILIGMKTNSVWCFELVDSENIPKKYFEGNNIKDYEKLPTFYSLIDNNDKKPLKIIAYDNGIIYKKNNGQSFDISQPFILFEEDKDGNEEIAEFYNDSLQPGIKIEKIENGILPDIPKESLHIFLATSNIFLKGILLFRRGEYFKYDFARENWSKIETPTIKVKEIKEDECVKVKINNEEVKLYGKEYKYDYVKINSNYYRPERILADIPFKENLIFNIKDFEKHRKTFDYITKIEYTNNKSIINFEYWISAVGMFGEGEIKGYYSSIYIPEQRIFSLKPGPEIFFQESYSYSEDGVKEITLMGKNILYFYPKIHFTDKLTDVSFQESKIRRKALIGNMRYLANKTKNEEALGDPDFYVKEEELLGISWLNSPNVNVEFNRGNAEAFESYFKLMECNTFEDLKNYGNDYFGLRKETPLN